MPPAVLAVQATLLTVLKYSETGSNGAEWQNMGRTLIRKLFQPLSGQRNPSQRQIGTNRAERIFELVLTLI